MMVSCEEERNRTNPPTSAPWASLLIPKTYSDKQMTKRDGRGAGEKGFREDTGNFTHKWNENNLMQK